nr:hypothetical protein [Syntrophales bacterium]
EVTLLTGRVSEGGFFYVLECDNHTIQKIIFKKLVDNRIYDIIDYVQEQGKWVEKIVDQERLNALKAGENFDMKIKKCSHIPEIELYNDIKQFYRMSQTDETEERLDKLEEVAKLIEEKINDDIGMDVLGSTNMGICQAGSDIDFVLYIRCPEYFADLTESPQYKKARLLLEEILRPDYAFQLMDCIDLGVVEKAIREKNYECEMTQRFVSYRSICRPINYRVIAPVEDLLNKDMDFRMELEGSIQSYFKIFINTSQHTRSFDKYERRLNDIGIKLPESIRQKVIDYLNRDGQENCP